MGSVNIEIQGDFMTEAQAIQVFVTQLANNIANAGKVQTAAINTLKDQLLNGQLNTVVMDIAKGYVQITFKLP